MEKRLEDLTLDEMKERIRHSQEIQERIAQGKPQEEPLELPDSLVIDVRADGVAETLAALEMVRAKAVAVNGELERMNDLLQRVYALAQRAPPIGGNAVAPSADRSGGS